ncbi:MAG: nuclear transport factor 2 family protein [Cyanobacteria bacterium J06649_4]
MTQRCHWLTRWIQPQLRCQKPASRTFVSAALLGLALSVSSASIKGLGTAHAASPDTAPAALTDAIDSIEAAASSGDLAGVMQRYSPDFTNEDGFTYETLEAALQTLWSRYDELTYRVELQSWEPVAGGFMAETVTYIDGTKQLNGQPTALESVIRSQQVFRDGRIVSQSTLSERNQVSSGDQPPTVSVILPEQVDGGEAYDFDAIVVEPLGNRYLLGAAVEEGTTATDFFTGRPVELELLSAGGLFKIGEAPPTPDSRWVSALLVRDDGLTVVTRRLQVN